MAKYKVMMEITHQTLILRMKRERKKIEVVKSHPVIELTVSWTGSQTTPVMLGQMLKSMFVSFDRRLHRHLS